MNSEALVYAAQTKTGVLIVQRGVRLHVFSDCCGTFLEDDDEDEFGNRWYCTACDKAVSNPVYGTRRSGPYNPVINWHFAHTETIRDWVAAWCGVSFGEVEVTIEDR